MDVSLKALRNQLYALRSWDSTGDSQDDRIRSALNLALDRLAGEVPEALVPDEEHAVLHPDVLGTDSDVASIAKMAMDVGPKYDSRILEFYDTAGVLIAGSGSATTWRPTVTGEWDGIMHIELTDKTTGAIHRRQCVEFFTVLSAVSGGGDTSYRVTLDRPLSSPIIGSTLSQYDFRIHQPEFFVSDDVMEVLEPAVVFDDTRQQVWKIDTAGASRQDMLDYKGNSKGRPYRCWRGRHFQIQAPTEAPRVAEAADKDSIDKILNWCGKGTKGLISGKYAICYTYVWGRRDFEWQKAPGVTPGSHEEFEDFGGYTNDDSLIWSYAVAGDDPGGATPPTNNMRYSGIPDPQWESAPSPVAIVDNSNFRVGQGGGLILSATNIDAMLGFGDSAFNRYKHSGLRIRYYVSRLEDAADLDSTGTYRSIETNERFYLLCEVEPTYNAFKDDSRWTTLPESVKNDSEMSQVCSGDGGAVIVWNGHQLFDYYRPLKHSTGYYAWKVFPHQDQKYELDLRVLRLPKKFIDDQDTAPIQRDAVSSLIELALYYISLNDGNDQASAQAHLTRYQDLVKVFRDRYANTGGIVEPVPFTGYRSRNRYGTFSASE